MSGGATPRFGTDVHLIVFLHGLRLDYRAHHTAAERFLSEWTAHHGTTRPPSSVRTRSASHAARSERLYLDR
ncbi:hypothetical protein ACWDO0_29080 [Nocardia rhamnosiphila]|uniref:hypothetical protein n=1 Tax=Nocardia rhamnosiphila TaxID=426716 RepID=UPI0033CCB58A